MRVRDDLLEQRSGLGRLLDAQEDERRRVAETLHEDLAQVLAAVLLGLRILRREAPGSSGVSLDDLHAQVVGVLADVREVARGLLPTRSCSSASCRRSRRSPRICTRAILAAWRSTPAAFRTRCPSRYEPVSTVSSSRRRRPTWETTRPVCA